MASSKAAKGLKLLYLPKKTPFDSPLGSRLPEAYKKFYREWKVQNPAPVHNIPLANKYAHHADTGEIQLKQEYPIPVKYPAEHNAGLWGGEGVVKGFQKRHPLRRRVAHFWVPVLKKSVVYSEVLDKHVAVVVTDRLIQLVHENAGFDNYLLKTPACDLKSELALKFKRKILIALANKDIYPDDAAKRQEVLSKYEHYLQEYDLENIEWYGLTIKEAFMKQSELEKVGTQPRALKSQYRLDLIQQLQDAGIEEASGESLDNREKSWISKINPFTKNKSEKNLKQV